MLLPSLLLFSSSDQAHLDIRTRQVANLSDDFEYRRVGIFEFRREELNRESVSPRFLQRKDLPTFCWPSAVDRARHRDAVKVCAATGRLHALQSNEPDLLAELEKDDMVSVYQEKKSKAGGRG